VPENPASGASGGAITSSAWRDSAAARVAGERSEEATGAAMATRVRVTMEATKPAASFALER
jgi:hypothetical protein